MDGEMLYAVLFPVTAGLVFAWMALGLPTPRCAIHELTGIPCLTCGTTRAVDSLVRGDWIKALRWNPGAIIAGVGLTMAWIYSGVVCLFGLRRFRPMPSRGVQNGVRIAIVLLVTANWIYLLFTLP